MAHQKAVDPGTRARKRELIARNVFAKAGVDPSLAYADTFISDEIRSIVTTLNAIVDSMLEIEISNYQVHIRQGGHYG